MKVLLLVALLGTTVLAKPAKEGSQKFSVKLGGRGRIIGGADAEVGQFPYQASYQWGIVGIWQHVCGATIISPTWLVSAGHCVTEVPEIGDFKVVVGIVDLFENSTERQDINVIKRLVHPEFSGGVGPNDISLLQLETPLIFGDLVQPASLPTADVDSGSSVLSGFGAITPDGLLMPLHLQFAELPILPIGDCRTAIDDISEGEENPLDDTSNICTGPLDGDLGACSGDSGGPLAQDGTLIGVVSWGFLPCGSAGAPSVYTRVTSFIDFIQENVDDLPK